MYGDAVPVPPVRRPDGSVVELRMLARGDRREWEQLRADNVQWLRRWEATAPEPVTVRLSFRAMVRTFERESRAGRLLPYAVAVDGRLVGQMHLFGLTWGSMRSASAGYWIASSSAGRGITPLALAMACDHAFGTLGLHRVEVNIRPDNAASLRVVEKLGFREEGLRQRLLHIDGAWHDHRSFAMTAEEVASSPLVGQLSVGASQAQQQPHGRHTEAGPR